MTKITDDVVTHAVVAAATVPTYGTPQGMFDSMRAALEAVAPDLAIQVDRQTLALLLADTVQTLDKDEEWVIADRVIALLRSSGEGGK